MSTPSRRKPRCGLQDYDASLMLTQSRRRRANINATLVHRLVFAGKCHT